MKNIILVIITILIVSCNDKPNRVIKPLSYYKGYIIVAKSPTYSKNNLLIHEVVLRNDTSYREIYVYTSELIDYRINDTIK